MRKIRILLIAGAVLLLAGPAAALTINPDPVHHSRDGATSGGPIEADVSLISISGSTLQVQLSVTTGSIDRLDFSFLGSPDLGGPTFNFTSSGSVGGGGIGGSATDQFGVEVQVVFDESVDAGESSGVISIVFQNAIAEGYQGAITFDESTLPIDETYYIESAPEAGAGLLLGLGAFGLVLRRRRRRC